MSGAVNSPEVLKNMIGDTYEDDSDIWLLHNLAAHFSEEERAEGRKPKLPSIICQEREDEALYDRRVACAHQEIPFVMTEEEERVVARQRATKHPRRGKQPRQRPQQAESPVRPPAPAAPGPSINLPSRPRHSSTSSQQQVKFPVQSPAPAAPGDVTNRSRQSSRQGAASSPSPSK
ncbi:hypothetical protein QBC35DRAFT_456387 [Podospora australis]|uniref:Uncharacterized protein n=1 Tax=Podospora australis TaxID=1536484 RepID=A0AAN6WKJ3_9PEZI|nr:hypothetical protein QBC35DRAFT_456387 [Podospora australis]